MEESDEDVKFESEDGKHDFHSPKAKSVKSAEQNSKIKNVIFYEQYPFPITNEHEIARIRTFTNFDDEDSKDKTKIMLKVANSNWNKQNYDVSMLQKFPIIINGKSNNQEKSDCEYSLVSNFKYLSYPFSKTTLITFVPKFKVYNKCSANIFIYQSNCEESLCLYPSEINEFHWTDVNKKKEIRIKYEGFNILSGPFKIDKS
mmetsp:Transcript_1059/g.1038  ORF Transcript_1059/g.1038 Transcript_1059/m.1038 type:complete len:202 (-) Transcript_1059:495-1100(-)